MMTTWSVQAMCTVDDRWVSGFIDWFRAIRNAIDNGAIARPARRFGTPA